MKLKLIDGKENYTAQVVQLNNVRRLPNSDNLQFVEIMGNICIVDLSVKDGDIGIFVPIESVINREFLSKNNLFSDPFLNSDAKTKGYISANCRIRATKLRGTISTGLIIKKESFLKVYPQAELSEGQEFNYVGEALFIDKYQPQVTASKGSGNPKEKKENTLSKRLLPDQFRLHYDTPQLGKFFHNITPDTEITVSEKLHGTSANFAKVLARKKFNIFDKVLKYLGANIQERDYEFVYASRSILKNRHDGQFTGDAWGRWAERISPFIDNGFSIYGEIVGFDKGGKAIQKSYDYSCPPNESELYIYRITYTNQHGQVTELSSIDIERVALKMGLKVVPVHFRGKAKHLFPEIINDENFSENFFKALQEKFLEKKCKMCRSGVWAEGVCLAVEDLPARPVFKLKSKNFILGETAERDKGETQEEE
jgi:hypothetical protein